VRLLRSVDPRIKSGKPERAADRERERGDPAEARRGLKRPEKQDQRRGGPESDVVGERIELGPEFALGAQEPRDSPVDPVEHSGEDNRSKRLFPFTTDREAYPGEAEA
jgi:hypothetical protein